MATSTDRVRRMRERRAASIEAGPDARLRDAAELLAPTVETAIGALELGERDAAAAQLARRYAAAIDEAKDPAAALRAFGPLLGKALDVLEDRGRGRGRQPGPQPVNPVREMRAAHAAFMGPGKR